MKHLVMLSSMVMFGMSTLAFADTAQVKVDKIRNANGLIQVAIYSTEKGFPSKSEQAYSTMQVPAQKRGVQLNVTIPDEGDYAIALYHDEDGNNRMKFNLFGIPQEGYGFSNNAEGTMGPPSFSSSKTQDRQLTILMKY